MCARVCGAVQFALPAGQGTVYLTVRVVGTEVVSNTMVYAYARAAVTSVTPSSGSNAGGTVLVITGSNLGIDLSAASFVAGACSSRNRVWLGPLPCTVLQVCHWPE